MTVTGTLGARAMSGFKWTGLSAALNLIFQLGFAAAMARLLQPADFGLMAMSVVALRLFQYFSQLGLGAALVQRESLSDEDVRGALGLTLLVCGAAVLGAVVSAPLIGAFFRTDEVVLLVRVLSANLLLVGLAAVPTALLRRALRFRELAIVETASYLLGYGVVGVAAALAGAGVWSLVATTFAQSALAFAGAYAFTRHPLRPSLRGERSALVRYGARHSVVSFLEFVAANLDAAAVGRLLGEAALGLYNRAVLLTSQPVERLSGVVARVLFPVLSAVQADRRKVGGVYLLGVAAVGTAGGAVSLGVSAAAPDVVRVVLGPGWNGAVPIVRVLALAVPLAFMSQVSGSVCDALALLSFKLRLQGASLATLAALVLVLHPWGALGIAWAVVGGEALRLAVYLIGLPRTLECRRGDVARVLSAVTMAALLAYGACAAASAFAETAGLRPLTALGLEISAGLAALTAATWLALRLLRGTEPGRLADASVPGWSQLRAKLGLSEASG